MKKSPIEPEVMKPFFYWLGLTFYACHQLEFGVKTVLVTMAGNEIGGFQLAEMVAIIEDEKKKTLGQVLELLLKRVRISEGWTSSLTAGLDARNRFVHRFLSEVDERSVNPATRAGVIAEMKAIRKVVLEANRAVQQILETLFDEAGHNWKELQAQWMEEVRAMNAISKSVSTRTDGAG